MYDRELTLPARQFNHAIEASAERKLPVLHTSKEAD